MHNLSKLLWCFPVILFMAAGCDQAEKTQSDRQTTKSALAADAIAENNGLITTSSPYDVSQTSDRLESIIKEKDLTVFNHIDHSANAANAELELKPTQVIIFGNPQVGTPLMQCSATSAIDLPQKILIYQDSANQTQIVYNDPNYLQKRHNIADCDPILEKVSGALEGIVKAAISE